jgi:tRNA pseudouridine55 synthase
MTNGLASIVAPPVLDGVLNVSKPVEWTSHDVVAKLRRSLGIRKVGHAGTLDPMATGVLPMLLGKGTRLSEYLVEWDKEYEAVLRLGQDTDTQDATGKVIQEQSYSRVTEEAIRTTVTQFLGLIEQVPPMYSALKVEGRPLYKLARAGKTVERKPRPITVFQLEILNIDIPDVSFRVTCSKGTYIRTLCADIGKSLGVGGHLRQLCRTRVGPFHIDNALSPLEINQEMLSQGPNQAVWGLDAVLSHLPEVVIDSSMVMRALNGAPIPQSAISRTLGEASKAVHGEEILRVKDPLGQFLGLGKFAKKDQDSSELDQPLTFVKVFSSSN